MNNNTGSWNGTLCNFLAMSVTNHNLNRGFQDQPSFKAIDFSLNILSLQRQQIGEDCPNALDEFHFSMLSALSYMANSKLTFKMEH